MAEKEFVDSYLPYLLARASFSISSEFHAQVEAAGFTVSEWRILASLSGVKQRTVGELADIVLAKQPTVTKMVLRMADQGLVMRTACTQDKRQAWVSLTLKGKKRVTPLLKKAALHENQVMKLLGNADSALLKSILQKLIVKA
ncbi:MAG: Transcriptional activatory protein BadR [Pseudomonadota bacterium]|jgi:DNA-binding MarR family transcriptional regulator|nr:MarR family transcriptional regulator [Limnohabitans sp.]